MSYDLAVWEGPRPATAEAASAEFERRMDRMEADIATAGAGSAPTPGIQGFVEAALARFPGLDEDDSPDCPWASAPLIGEASGDLIYFPLTWSGAERAVDALASIASERGLVMYDPQGETLLPADDASAGRDG